MPIKPRTDKVTVYQGDDLAILADLDSAVAAAQLAVREAEKRAKEPQPPRLMTDDAPTPVATLRSRLDTAQANRDAFAAEAQQRGVLVVMHALPRKKWRELVTEHPPREGEKADTRFGINMSTAPEVLIPASIDREASTIEGDTLDFLESLSDFDYYDELFVTAFALNRGSAMADPTQRLASETSQT